YMSLYKNRYPKESLTSEGYFTAKQCHCTAKQCHGTAKQCHFTTKTSINLFYYVILTKIKVRYLRVSKSIYF
ncbi:MAG TPA: hypothetical protein VFD33_08430, partial [Bacillota bacterium]|nr:hypothetical protein [Bacillota bacterium]